MGPAIYRTEAGGQAVRERYRAFLAAWPIANTKRHVPTSFGETFVVSCGPEGAPDVLLLHGSAANSASWMGDVALLANGRRIHAIDLIGEPGLSAPSRPPLAGGGYAEWLGEVLGALSVEHAALIGISLGGWVALDYATRCPGNVSAVVLLCPGGVGRQRNVLLWAAPLSLLGRWGRERILERLAGGPRPPGGVPPAVRAFGEFMDLIFANFRPRNETLPLFDDARLRKLSMSLLAILGARDAMIDSRATRARLARCCPQAEILWLPRAGHILTGHAADIDAFLTRKIPT